MLAATQESYLAEIVAQMAHDANLTWGTGVDSCGPDRRPWADLPIDEKTKKGEILSDLASQYIDAPFSEEQLHNKWLETAPEGHPSKVKHSSLPDAQRIKDTIYLSFIKIYVLILEIIEA